MRRASTIARQLTAAAGARKPVCLVVGAGDATGGAVARRFARDGFTVCVVRRHEDKLAGLVDAIRADGGAVVPFGCDARREEQVVDLVNRIEADIGDIEVAVHNIGANVRFDLADTTTRVYTKVWEMACLSAFLVGREVSKKMVDRKRGTIIITGATASLRGKEGFAAFAGAKHAKRALASSMARELGPKGVHVAHPIVDGPIDTAFIRSIMGNENFEAALKTDSVLNPDDIAEAYMFLHRQPRSAWTFELDLRPWDQTYA